MNGSNRTNDYGFLERKLQKISKIDYHKKATIIIPFFKCKEILEKTLVGLTLQIYPNELFEVIIGNESGEGLENLIDSYASFFEIKSFNRFHHGYEVSTLRNELIQRARYDTIIQLDFDMLTLPMVVESHMRWFHIYEKLATIGPRKFVDTSSLSATDILKNNDELYRLPDIRSISNTGKGTIDKRMLEFLEFKKHSFPYNCFHGCNVAFPRQSALNVGLYDEDFNLNFGYQDIEFGYRLWKSGLYFIFEPRALALHQENSVVTPAEREKGRKINLALLFTKVPELKELRKTLSN